MSIDDMNPFMNNSTHSTWPIVLMILNLSPWLCNKQKYIMMSVLIPGPQHPGNDIDTYFKPLVEDLKEARPASPSVVPVEATPMLISPSLLYFVIFFLTQGSFCKILACNLSRYCIYSSYFSLYV
jgi:hypothetical protein